MRASHSEIQCYLDCRVKHHFRYRQRLPLHTQVPELDRGLAVHAGMEYACNNLAQRDSATWFREAQDVAHQDLRRRWLMADNVDYAAVRAGVRAGCEYLREIEIVEVLGVERRIQPVIEDWTPNGAIDFLWRDSYGRIHIDDWKSAKELKQPTIGVPDGQTALYGYWALREFDVQEVYGGRVYLRTEQPQTSITQKGKFSQSNAISHADYLAYIADDQGAALDPDIAINKFKSWWRADIDVLTLRLCKAVLRDQMMYAREIEENRPPGGNRRPNMCIRCEYLAPCVDRMLNGEDDRTRPFNG